MKRKILGFLICMMLVTIVLPTSIRIKSVNVGINNGNILSNVEYVLDQKQLLHDGDSKIHRSIWMAQSFKPSMTPLTKVLLKIEKPVVIEYPLELSIRRYLNGSELTYMQIPSSQIPYYIHWVEFDFADIEVEIGETYYMVIRTNSPSGKSYRWLDNYNQTGDSYENGKQWISFHGGYDWSPTEYENSFIDSTFQTYSYISDPDLYCSGLMNWTDIEPASTVTGSFTVENIGSPLSYINWEITHWPTWGVWTFTPSGESKLRPEDGITTVHLSVVSPNVTNNKYTGKIIITNMDDSSDFCTIDVSLATPKSQYPVNFHAFQFLEKIIARLPFLERILSSHSFMGNILTPQ